MGKRSIDDSGLSQEAENASKDHTTKKSRKEKRKLTEDATVAPETTREETKEERKERKKAKKLKKLQDQAVSNDESPTPSDEAGAVDAAAAAKAEKKAKKAESKAKKLAEEQVEDENKSTIAPAASSGSVGSQVTGSYVESAELAALPKTKIDSFLAEHFITITDPKSSVNTIRPIIDFAYLPITDPAQRAPFKDFKAPTPIQAAAWPFLLAGRDVIGVAETGSGKTMAFAVPCVQGILKMKKSKGAKAVIVSPTRELAMQSYEQITKLTQPTGLQAVCVYGGVPKDEQRKALRTADIVIATPGRLNDLINEGCADLSNVGYVVLDEADRMLDKGFEEEIRKIINTTPPTPQRQTLMFTATWPESVRALASTFMTSPIKIAIGDNPTGDLRANTRIVQKVEVVDPRGKEFRLLQLLKQYQSGTQKDDRIIVFCLYKKEATRVEGFIRSKGIRVAGIHGDLSQEQRTRSLDAFKKGSTPVLVATDVAARGLDIPAVKLVINCTFPLTVEDYVHRIGRTGRAGKEGLAITLFTEHDKAQSGA
jgi:ATP-dependent RNA helicase DBP3